MRQRKAKAASLVPRFSSSIVPQRPIIQRQAIAAAAVQSASASAAVADEIDAQVAAAVIDPGTSLGNVLHEYETRIYALENPIP